MPPTPHPRHALALPSTQTCPEAGPLLISRGLVVWGACGSPSGPSELLKTRATNRNRRLTVARPCSASSAHCAHLGRAGPGAEGSKLRFVAVILAIHWGSEDTAGEPRVGIILWRDRSEGKPSRCSHLWASSPTRTRGRGLKMTVASADGDHFTSGRRRSKLFLV